MSTLMDTGNKLYGALSAGDVDTLRNLLSPQFRGELTAGLPRGLGRTYEGLDTMLNEGWGAVSRCLAMAPEPVRLFDGGDVLIARGFYVGHVVATGKPVRAAFAHFWDFNGERFTGVIQVTDSATWEHALAVGPVPGFGDAPEPVDAQAFADRHGLGPISEKYARGAQLQHAVDPNLPATIQSMLNGIAPDFGKIIVEYVFADLYARPGLDLKTRMIATLAAVTVLNQVFAVEEYVRFCVNGGWSRTEVVEVIMQMSVTHQRRRDDSRAASRQVRVHGGRRWQQDDGSRTRPRLGGAFARRSERDSVRESGRARTASTGAPFAPGG